ncbi:MAG TPA: lysoplasmalogenase [Acidimicrobiales bacterium]|nr:lysoplasmalogenase [Acidimicrobiales bacterium]
MTLLAAFLLGVAGVFAVADWVAVARRALPLEHFAKPATLVVLVGVALALDPANTGRRTWFAVALVLSLAGDVLLMLAADDDRPGDAAPARRGPDRFVLGLVAFLVAHVLYIAGFGLSRVWPAVVPVAVVAVVVGQWILRGVRRTEPGLATPVAVYMVVISVMVACAIGSGSWWAGAGAALFFASDALIAVNRFVRPVAWAPVAIMVLYHLGQAGLVLSLA